MRVLLWLIFHVPGLVFLFFRVFVPVWNFLISSIESLYYIRRRKQALVVLLCMQNDIRGTLGLALWYAGIGFKGAADPMGGLLDFSSKPWVSILKNRGDCDDMMLIAEAVLGGKYDAVHKCFTYHEDGRGHAICLFRGGPTWWVMSSRKEEGPFGTLQEASRFFYGDKTKYVFIYSRPLLAASPGKKSQESS